MGNFFSFAQHNKKFIVLVVLVAVVLSIIPAPKPAAANWLTRNVARYICYITPAGLWVTISTGAYEKLSGEEQKGCRRYIDEEGAQTLGDAAAPFVVGLGRLFINLTELFARLAYGVFDYISNVFVKNESGRWTITSSGGAVLAPAFITAWNITKQWANIIIVVALIAVALAFMLGLPAFDGYKKLLVPILITALLVNFSGLLVGFMIDIANVAMLTFFGQTTASSIGQDTIVPIIKTLWSSVSTQPTETIDQAAQYTTYAVGFSLIYIVVGITLFVMSIFFIIRYAVLALLFIVAPLAFALRVLPMEKAQKAWGTWWGMLVHWATAGVVAAFFINLGSQLTVALFGEAPPVIQDTSEETVLAVMGPLVVKFAIIIVFLNMGLFMAIKSSTMVVSALAAGSALAGGALALTGKLVPKSVRDRVQRARDTVTDNKLLNPIRDFFRGPGASAMIRQNRNQALMKPLIEQYSNASNEDLAKQAAKSGVRGAAAMAVLHTRDSIGDIKHPADRKAAMENLLQHDNKLKINDFAKKDYRYAEFDDKKVEKQISKAKQLIEAEHLQTGTALPTGIRMQTLVQDRTKQLVRQQQLEENLPSMSGNQIRGIGEQDWNPELMVSMSMNPGIIRKLKTADINIVEKATNLDVENEMNDQIQKAHDEGNGREVNRLQNIAKELLQLKLSSGLPLTAQEIPQPPQPPPPPPPIIPNGPINLQP